MGDRDGEGDARLGNGRGNYGPAIWTRRRALVRTQMQISLSCRAMRTEIAQPGSADFLLLFFPLSLCQRKAGAVTNRLSERL